MTVKWLGEALRDIEESTTFYARKDPGEEVRFAHHLEAAVAKVIRDPNQSHLFDPPYHRVFLNVFPHQLIYVIDDHTVWFVAVAHPARQKSFWKDRL